MTYKTILVHCNDARRVRGLLAPAVALTEKFEAHLIGLSVVPPASLVAVGAFAAPPIIDDSRCRLYQEQNPALRSAFHDMTRGRPFPAEWRDADAGVFGVADAVLEHGRAVDLIMANQTDPEWPANEWLDVADRLALESGRPVLIVPNSGKFEFVGRRILVAWNGRREAARAVFDALPLLRSSEATKVVWVGAQGEDRSIHSLPANDVCQALARHGVKCHGTEQITSQSDIGETLMDCAKGFGADLVVMGCYGHSRFREFVFGGASRYFLTRGSLPVLMSH
jgi:nucleotide-binding universal stress UspA family protein